MSDSFTLKPSSDSSATTEQRVTEHRAPASSNIKSVDEPSTIAFDESLGVQSTANANSTVALKFRKGDEAFHSKSGREVHVSEDVPMDISDDHEVLITFDSWKDTDPTVCKAKFLERRIQQRQGIQTRLRTGTTPRKNYSEFSENDLTESPSVSRSSSNLRDSSDNAISNTSVELAVDEQGHHSNVDDADDEESEITAIKTVPGTLRRPLIRHDGKYMVREESIATAAMAVAADQCPGLSDPTFYHHDMSKEVQLPPAIVVDEGDRNENVSPISMDGDFTSPDAVSFHFNDASSPTEPNLLPTMGASPPPSEWVSPPRVVAQADSETVTAAAAADPNVSPKDEASASATNTTAQTQEETIPDEIEQNVANDEQVKIRGLEQLLEKKDVELHDALLLLGKKELLLTQVTAETNTKNEALQESLSRSADLENRLTEIENELEGTKKESNAKEDKIRRINRIQELARRHVNRR